jgi:predicted DNA-binding transcriptional regulator
MRQSKRESLVEACINTASAFFLSLLIWQYLVAPLYGFRVSWQDNFGITTIFTIASILRGYVWRRVFNRGWNRAVMRWIRNVTH